MVISRLGPPFGECKNIKQPHVDLNVFEELYPVNYSSNACFKTCYQRHMIERCDCGDAYYPMKGLAFGDARVVACRTTNITQDDCRYEVQRMFANNELDCDCTSPCFDSEFDLLISTGQWPSDVQQAAILTRLKPKIESLLSEPTDKYKYKRNLIKLVVYFEEFNVERISENEAYAVANYLSDIGGLLGLWLGCSILTVAEFLELFMDLAVLSVIKRRGRNRINKVSIKQDPSV
ncbi:Amiloride-sensitive sodium channel subunit beta [Lamellibrachia satsuma]|nr:Amiloride-sensitive sodium channel subunit beta [Lamellibrachia satsuma]